MENQSEVDHIPVMPKGGLWATIESDPGINIPNFNFPIPFLI
jgi:hypothetical protein